MIFDRSRSWYCYGVVGPKIGGYTGDDLSVLKYMVGGKPAEYYWCRIIIIGVFLVLLFRLLSYINETFCIRFIYLV